MKIRSENFACKEDKSHGKEKWAKRKYFFFLLFFKHGRNNRKEMTQ